MNVATIISLVFLIRRTVRQAGRKVASKTDRQTGRDRMLGGKKNCARLKQNQSEII